MDHHGPRGESQSVSRWRQRGPCGGIHASSRCIGRGQRGGGLGLPREGDQEGAIGQQHFQGGGWAGLLLSAWQGPSSRPAPCWAENTGAHAAHEPAGQRGRGGSSRKPGSPALTQPGAGIDPFAVTVPTPKPTTRPGTCRHQPETTGLHQAKRPRTSIPIASGRRGRDLLVPPGRRQGLDGQQAEQGHAGGNSDDRCQADDLFRSAYRP